MTMDFCFIIVTSCIAFWAVAFGRSSCNKLQPSHSIRASHFQAMCAALVSSVAPDDDTNLLRDRHPLNLIYRL